MTPLIVIHLARKPLSGTVVGTVLQYGTGALNIDGTRIGTAGCSEDDPSENVSQLNPDKRRTRPLRVISPKQSTNGAVYAGRQDGKTGFDGGSKAVGTTTLGRWPSNLILQHTPSCRLVDTHYEDFLIQRYTDSTTGNFSFFGGSSGSRPDLQEPESVGQMVEDWACVEGCPVKDLDKQSGVLTSGQVKPGYMKNGTVQPSSGGFEGGFGSKDVPLTGYGDTGGASRYFKQVITMHDLYEYLRTLISPPPGTGRPVAVVLTAWPEDAGTWAKASCSGFIIHGFTPTDLQMKVLYDVLVPGGHVCLFAPDTQPTGHTGAIRMEDTGFEIRDALLWVRGPGRLHYVAKASRREREAGCQALPAKQGHEAVDRQEGSAGAESPRAGAGRTADSVKNFHPTVKPIELMVRLLEDVPHGLVVEPFLGSGSTLIACRQTGHDALGIERETEYLRIAEARIRYWDSASQGWLYATIQSDLKAPEVSVPDLDLFDLLI